MAAALGVVGFQTEALAATTVSVTTTAGGLVSNTSCGLQEAVASLNAGKGLYGCTLSGSGTPNTVALQSGTRTYTLTAPLVPKVNMTIQGASRTTTTILVNASTSGSAAVEVANPTNAYLSVDLLDLTLKTDPANPPSNRTGIRVIGDSSQDFQAWLTVTRCRVNGFGNSGIRSQHGGVNIEYSLIDGNSSPDTGGGVYFFSNLWSGPSLNARGSVFRNNHSTWSGGGIYSMGGGNSHIEYSTIAQNSSHSGGGLFLQIAGGLGYMELNHVTVAENDAFSGGGVYCNACDARVRTSGSIYAYNTAAQGPEVDGLMASMSSIYYAWDEFDDVMHGFGDQVEADPFLGPLMDMGGNGLVVYPLLSGSTALDYVEPSFFGTVDQRGFPLAMDAEGGTSPDWSDVGAYEHGPAQTELLAVAAKHATPAHVLNAGSYSGGFGTWLQATAVNHYVTYAVPVPEPGTYSIKVGVKKGPDRGITQLATANSLGGTYTNRGSPLDLYKSNTTGAYQELSLVGSNTTVSFSSAGTKYFRFTVTGKNVANTTSNYYLLLDYVKLIKQ